MLLKQSKNSTMQTRLLLGFGLMGLTLVAAPLTMHIVQGGRDLQSVRLKQIGIAPLKALLRMVHLQQQHRGLSAVALAGSTTIEAQRTAKQTEVNKAVETFDAIVASDIHDPALTVTWRMALEAWRGLANGVSSRSISGQESFYKHTAIINEDLKLLELTLDYFGLSYDLTGHDYHLTMALLFHLPQLTELLGQLRARGLMHLVSKSMRPVDRIALLSSISNVERQYWYVEHELSEAAALHPLKMAEMSGIVTANRALTQKAVDLTRSQVVEAGVLSYPPAEYWAVFTQVIDGQFALLDKAMVDLEGALQARIAAERSGQIKMIGFIVLVIAFAVWLGMVIARATRQDIATLEQSEKAQRLAATQLTEKVVELQRAQTRLLDVERLRAMGQMAAGVAHDFNNALMGILGQAQLMRLSLEQEPVAAALHVGGCAALLECLARQEQVALDAAETIRKIREATRPRNEETFRPVALDELIEQILAITRPRWKGQAEAAGVQITVRTDMAQTPPVLGHAAELREALTNLLFNALDAMPQGGTITITTRHVQSAERERQGWVTLSMTDTGVGMPPAVQARIFEPFFSTKGVRGTGLGLSMVHGIVSRHQGEITIQSAERAGTTVTLRLPVAEAEAAEATSPPDASLPIPGPLKLLVIDDVPLLAETLSDLLRLLGHEATIATGGKKGIARLTAERFDMVMTDLGMPEMSGWEVAQAVKARWPQLPVILVTGWGDALEGEPLESRGVDAVLAKPYTVAQLQAALAQCSVDPG